MDPPRVLVMAKYPTAGAVKTRLAARVGAVAAARLQEAFLRDLGDRLAQAALEVTWAVSPPGAPLERIVPHARVVPQGPGDLGARMAEAMGRLFAERAGTVVTLGGDVPHLDPAVACQADEALDEGADCVLGPAEDGGYYLVALRAPAAVLFTGVSWGTDAVLEQTLARAAAADLRVALLAPTFDVDAWDDVLRLRRLLAAGRVCLPATATVLATLPELP